MAAQDGTLARGLGVATGLGEGDGDGLGAGLGDALARAEGDGLPCAARLLEPEQPATVNMASTAASLSPTGKSNVPLDVDVTATAFDGTASTISPPVSGLNE